MGGRTVGSPPMGADPCPARDLRLGRRRGSEGAARRNTLARRRTRGSAGRVCCAKAAPGWWHCPPGSVNSGPGLPSGPATGGDLFEEEHGFLAAHLGRGEHPNPLPAACVSALNLGGRCWVRTGSARAATVCWRRVPGPLTVGGGRTASLAWAVWVARPLRPAGASQPWRGPPPAVVGWAGTGLPGRHGTRAGVSWTVAVLDAETAGPRQTPAPDDGGRATVDVWAPSGAGRSAGHRRNTAGRARGPAIRCTAAGGRRGSGPVDEALGLDDPGTGAGRRRPGRAVRRPIGYPEPRTGAGPRIALAPPPAHRGPVDGHNRRGSGPATSGAPPH